MPTTPLPTVLRRLLLDVLAAGYRPGAAQTRLGNAPDGAVAWQVQALLDDYADAGERFAFADAA